MLGFVFFNSRRYIECFVQLMLCSYVVRVSLTANQKKTKKHTQVREKKSTPIRKISSPPPLPLTSPPVAIRASDSIERLRLALERHSREISFESFELRFEFFNLTEDAQLCDHFLRTPYESLSDTDIVNFLRESFNCKRLLYRARRTYSLQKRDENSVKSEEDDFELRKVMYEAHQKYREASKKPLQVLSMTLDSSSDMDSSSDSLDSSNDMDSSNDSRKKDEIVEVEKRICEDDGDMKKDIVESKTSRKRSD